MIEKRKALGFENPLENRTLDFGEWGFTFTGLPTTPIGHWESLAASIPPDVRASMKRLE
jgi:hypothetical protein